MPDLRDTKTDDEKDKVELKGPGDWPGDNNTLPNTDPVDSEDLPAGVERDVSNEGMAQDPADKPIL